MSGKTNVQQTLETSTPVKKFWLTTFGGYDVTATRRSPMVGLFGRIRYKNVWVLNRRN